MNRREFTLLLGTSIAQLALPAKPVSRDNMSAGQNAQLNEIRKFWYKNFKQNPNFYLANHNINETNFQQINQNELQSEYILEFEGVYFSYCELAILASLAPIAV